MKFSVIIILLILLTQTLVFAQSVTNFSQVEFDPEKLSERGKYSFETLLKTKTFTLNGFGAAAAPHLATRALADLLKEKSVEKALQFLVRNATPEGRIYGLLGLQVINSKQFKPDFAIFKTLPIPKDEISSSDGGCSPETTSLKRAEIIKDLETGAFDKRFSYVFDIKELRK